MTTALKQVKPSSSRNLRARISCAHRSYTVRASKKANVEKCEKCAAGANNTYTRNP